MINNNYYSPAIPLILLSSLYKPHTIQIPLFALTKSYASNTIFIHNLTQACSGNLTSINLFKDKWSRLNGTERTQKYNMSWLISLNPLYNWIFDLLSSARSSYTSGSWAPVEKKKKSFIVHLNSHKDMLQTDNNKRQNHVDAHLGIPHRGHEIVAM